MRRDRHDRGMRGPMAAPNALTPQPATPRRPTNRTAFFDEVVEATSRRIRRTCPEALSRVEITVTDVPEITDAWTDIEPPLTAGIDGSDTAPARIVIYRRPLEQRATSRSDLRALVRRAFVEQLSALTTIAVREIDPELDAG